MPHYAALYSGRIPRANLFSIFPLFYPGLRGEVVSLVCDRLVSMCGVYEMRERAV